jgi:hypothetical protein
MENKCVEPMKEEVVGLEHEGIPIKGRGRLLTDFIVEVFLESSPGDGSIIRRSVVVNGHFHSFH